VTLGARATLLPEVALVRTVGLCCACVVGRGSEAVSSAPFPAAAAAELGGGGRRPEEPALGAAARGNPRRGPSWQSRLLRPPLPSGPRAVTPFSLSVFLQAAHRVPPRINDLTERRSRAPSGWLGSVVSPGLADWRTGRPEDCSLPRRGEKQAEQRGRRRRSRGACGGKGSSGPGRASAGRRLSQRGSGARAAAAAAAAGGCERRGR
jgi:hypothetical protein